MPHFVHYQVLTDDQVLNLPDLTPKAARGETQETNVSFENQLVTSPVPGVATPDPLCVSTLIWIMPMISDCVFGC